MNETGRRGVRDSETASKKDQVRGSRGGRCGELSEKGARTHETAWGRRRMNAEERTGCGVASWARSARGGSGRKFHSVADSTESDWPDGSTGTDDRQIARTQDRCWSVLVQPEVRSRASGGCSVCTFLLTDHSCVGAAEAHCVVR